MTETVGYRHIGAITDESNMVTSVAIGWADDGDLEWIILEMHQHGTEGQPCNPPVKHILEPAETLELAHYLQRAAGLALEAAEDAPHAEHELKKMNER